MQSIPVMNIDGLPCMCVCVCVAYDLSNNHRKNKVELIFFVKISHIKVNAKHSNDE